MSIAVEFLLDEQPGKLLLGKLVPGEIATFSDYSANSRDVMAISCNLDDSGGEVHLFENEGFAENRNWRLIDERSLAYKNLLAVIMAGEKFERDIVTSTRQKGRLILSHIIVS